MVIGFLLTERSCPDFGSPVSSRCASSRNRRGATAVYSAEPKQRLPSTDEWGRVKAGAIRRKIGAIG